MVATAWENTSWHATTVTSGDFRFIYRGPEGAWMKYITIINMMHRIELEILAEVQIST